MANELFIRDPQTGQFIPFKISGDNVAEVAVGSEQPTDPNVLLWYDTNGEIAPPAEQPPAAGNIAVFDANGRVVDGQTPIRDWATREQVSNANLLINWYFADPINQRGQTEYATDGYIIDRWKKFSGTNTARITDEGLAFSGNGVNSHRMIQPIENAAFLNGKSITLSALVKNPNSEFQIGIQNQTTGVLKKFSIEPSADFTVISFTTSIAVSPNDIVNFLMYPSKTSSVYEVVVSAAKLELGDHQTLAHQDANGNWVLNDPPPDKAVELSKCQRYFFLLKKDYLFNPVLVGPNIIDFNIYLNTYMKEPASIIGDGFQILKNNGATIYEDFKFSIVLAGSYIRLRATKTNHGLTLENALLNIGNNQSGFDAEIY